jgi:hypothetical protein
MSLAGKLQLKPHHRVVVVNRPPDVELDVGEVEPTAGVEAARAAEAVIAFVRSTADLEGAQMESVLAAGRRDALVWVAYPKAGRLGTDLNRDILASLLEERGVRPVRQIAIGDTWSALRFRPAE